MLTGLGYHVTAKTGAREALALFRLDPSRFDLVIYRPDDARNDRRRPCREIFALRMDMPIIMCTGIAIWWIATVPGRQASKPSP